MTGRRLLALSALAITFGCQDQQLPTGPSVVGGRSSIVSDGAHGGNPDFFFLPPLVKVKKNDPNFELGAFNSTLKPSLKVEICELQAETSNPQGLPTDLTACAATVKTFSSAAIELITLPSARRDIPKEFRHEEWWKGPKRSSDGFYYVLWDTGQPDLNLEKFYRIKVLIVGSTPGSDITLGFADVDPKGKGGPKWKYSRTRDVIDMVDNVKLPIPFRVENAGALCTGADNCTSVTVPNNNPNGEFTLVTVEGGAGSIAGASFPDNWLPPGGPQSVVVTITEVTSALNEDGSRITPCHFGLPLQQFNKCFQFTTTPALQTVDGRQFALDVTVAVCYALEGTGDPREEFVELYTSGPDEETEALEDVSDEGILGAGARDCTTEVIGLESSNPVKRFASSGWRKLKGGLGHVFGVKTAYAVDVGLGGLVKRFSNIGPALSAEIEGFPIGEGEGPIQLGLESGVAIGRAKIVGTHVHAGEEEPERHGLNSVPVTFTVASGNGTLRPLNTEEGDDLPSVTVITSFFSDVEVDGIASVEWTPPTVPGTYTMTAVGPTTNGPIAFSVTVPPVEEFLPDFAISSGTPVLTPAQVTISGGIVTLSSTTVANLGGSFALAGGVRFGVYLSTDATITSADQLVGSANIPPGSLESGGTFNLPFPVGNIPSGVAPGNYFLGFLIDDNNAVAESNEGNNFVSAPFAVVSPLRMVSMQTGATIQFTWDGPPDIATWQSSNTENVLVSVIGQVVAEVGGENSNGGDGATVTSVLTTGAAGPTWLVNSPFTIFPRVTTAVWVPVQGAASYDVAVEHGNGCSGYANCELWTPSVGSTTGISGSISSFTFSFVGSQPGRWRLTARDVTGAILAGSPSPWIFFRYEI